MEIFIEDIAPDDRVIAVMGPTGSGKDNYLNKFIDVLLRRPPSPDSQSEYRKNTLSRKIETFALQSHNNFRVVLVVIPGFGGLQRSDVQNLVMTSRWFEKTYRRNIKLTAILYLHQISGNRISGPILRDIRMFGEFCGDKIMSRVLVVTTMWEQVSEASGERRERELKEGVWSTMLAKGSGTARFKGDYSSAKQILSSLTANEHEKEVLLLQEEMVNLGKRWSETHAARMLRQSLLELSSEQKMLVEKLRGETDGKDSGSTTITPHLLGALREERNRAEEEYKQTLYGIRTLGVPTNRKLLSRFRSPKRGEIKPLSAFSSTEPPSTMPPTAERQDTSEDRSKRNRSTGVDTEPLNEHPDTYFDSVMLIRKLSTTPASKNLMSKLKDNEAQCMVNFLHNLLLWDRVLLSSQERRHTLSLLCKLTQLSQNFPEQCTITNLSCDFNKLVNDGGYGLIYKGDYRGQTVCVKLARIFTQSHDISLKIQAKELILWAHLSHQNILPFYGIHFESSGRLCIVSPWMQNGDLTQYLSAHPDAPKIPIIIDIVAGLRYLHNLKIIHADLKANNVLISEGKRALLADFGISRVYLSQALSIEMGGATRWMAPELLACEPLRATMSSDIWSFGCVCYEVFVRKYPYHRYEYTVQLLLALLKTRMVPLLPEEEKLVQPDIAALMKSCWEQDPEKRPDCGMIQASLAQYQVLNNPREKYSDDPTFSQVRGARHHVKLDYQLVYSILCRVQAQGLVSDKDEEGLDLRDQAVN